MCHLKSQEQRVKSSSQPKEFKELNTPLRRTPLKTTPKKDNLIRDSFSRNVPNSQVTSSQGQISNTRIPEPTPAISHNLLTKLSQVNAAPALQALKMRQLEPIQEKTVKTNP